MNAALRMRCRSALCGYTGEHEESADSQPHPDCAPSVFSILIKVMTSHECNAECNALIAPACPLSRWEGITFDAKRGLLYTAMSDIR